MKKSLILIIFLATVGISAFADIKLPSFFSDGMVLQQKIKVPVWGWGNPNDKVKVIFDNQCKITTVNPQGKWMICLEPLQASAKPATLSIEVAGEKKVINDILVGEVWLCTGQSNMDFTLGRLATSRVRNPKNKPIAEYLKKEIASATDPLLRQIAVPRAMSVYKTKDNFNGSWIKSTPQNNSKFTGVGYFFAKELRKKLQVPVGLIKCAWGGTRVEPWIPMNTYKNPKYGLNEYYQAELQRIAADCKKFDSPEVRKNYLKRLERWKIQVKNSKGRRRPRKPRPPVNPLANKQQPSTLYNAIINPLIPYAIKGAIWYQGESNERYYPTEYAKRFQAMIKGWRENWNQGSFPFYYVQLANYRNGNKEPVEKDFWATVCNQQRLSLQLENTGMAVINDIGEARNIHPKNKMDTGKRLALWAFAKDYGYKDIVYCGPLYKSSSVVGNKMVITFTSVGDGLMVGKKVMMNPTIEVDEPLKQFQICGADRKWKWATAKIIAKDKVEVYHPQIKHPVEVRYAWSCNPSGANLYNKAGLPTSVFKTNLNR